MRMMAITFYVIIAYCVKYILPFYETKPTSLLKSTDIIRKSVKKAPESGMKSAEPNPY